MTLARVLARIMLVFNPCIKAEQSVGKKSLLGYGVGQLTAFPEIYGVFRIVKVLGTIRMEYWSW